MNQGQKQSDTRFVRAKETARLARDAFVAMFRGPWPGFAPELASAIGPGMPFGSDGRARWKGYHPRPPSNVLLELSDPGPNERVEYEASLKSAIPSERAKAATHAMRNAVNFSDEECARDIFRALEKETDPRVATVMLGAYAVAAKKLNIREAFENLLGILESREKTPRRFERTRSSWDEKAFGSFDLALLGFDMALIDAFAEVPPNFAKKVDGRQFRDVAGFDIIGGFGAATESGMLKLRCVEVLGDLTMPVGNVGVSPDELRQRIDDIRTIIEGKLPADSREKIIEAGQKATESLERLQNDRSLPLPPTREIWSAERAETLAGRVI